MNRIVYSAQLWNWDFKNRLEISHFNLSR